MNRKQFFKSTLALAAATTVSWDTEANSENHNELNYHSIDDIKFGRVKLTWPRLVGKNARLDVHGLGPSVDIAVITTRQGATGWGSVSKSRISNVDEINSQLKGKKVAELLLPASGVLKKDFDNFEFALYDLAGKILGKPVYNLLGRKKPLTFPCYSGMIYFDDLEPSGNPAGLQKIKEECAFDRNYGYRQVKLKIGRGNKWMEREQGIKRDIEVTRMVHENFPDLEILVDANDGYRVDDFITYLEGIRGIPLFWIEEPFAENVDDYRKLNNWLEKNNVKVLLADGEYNSKDDLLFDLAEKKLIDVFIQDIQGYGFTKWMKLMPILKSMGILASPHNWGSILKTNYTAHLTAALGNTATIEGVTTTSDDVDLSGYELKYGKLIPSPKPGFGMDLLMKL
jgi:D-galactarolactone cycloisomerase